MLGDLLRYLSGPTPYSGWWVVIAALVGGLMIGAYLGVFAWTVPPALHGNKMLGGLHRRLRARRFVRIVAAITADWRAGAISAPQACGAYSRALRSFLHVATGRRAQYMHVDDLAAGELAPAAPLIAALNDARFAPAADVDVEGLGQAVEEVIRTWT